MLRQRLLKVYAPLGLALTIGLLCLTLPALAAQLVVNTAVDENDGSCEDGDCSLRDAIAVAADGDIITFAGDYTIYLNSQLDLTKTLTIDGSSHAITVSGDSGGDGSPNVRVMSIRGSGVVTLSHLSIISGTYTYGGGIDIGNIAALTLQNSTLSGNSANEGGGIYNNGLLTIQNSTLSGNSAADWGGGIESVGTLTIQNSTLSNNSALADEGGGISNWGGLTLQNSTLSGNSAGNFGGGIYNEGTASVQNSTFYGNSSDLYGGGISNHNTLTVQNSTLSGNSAYIYGGGIYNRATLNLSNTLIANNDWQDCANEAGYGTVGTNDHNLIESVGFSACDLVNGVNGNIIGVDPRLASLGHYGGATQTFALSPDSPAIDAGNACLTTDQRGQARDDLQCDIGAYELKYPDSHTVSRSVSSTIGTTFGPALVGIQRDAGLTDPGVITVTKGAWSPQGPESIGAQWTITPTVTSGFSLTLQACYTVAELGGLTESNLRFYRSDGITYTRLITAPVLSIVNGYHCAALSGINQLSRWTLATDVPTAIALNELSAHASGDATSSLEFGLLLSVVLVIGGGAWFRRQTYRR